MAIGVVHSSSAVSYRTCNAQHQEKLTACQRSNGRKQGNRPRHFDHDAGKSSVDVLDAWLELEGLSLTTLIWSNVLGLCYCCKLFRPVKIENNFSVVEVVERHLTCYIRMQLVRIL